MKHSVLSIVLLMSFSMIGSVLHAGDQKKTQYQFGEIDKILFFNYDTKKFGSPYPSALVDAASADQSVVVEKGPLLFSLCDSALKMSKGLSEWTLRLAVYDIGASPDLNPLGKAHSRAQEAHKRAAKVTSLLSDLNDTVTIAKQDLMFLLQFGSCGIKRTDDRVEIVLRTDKPENIVAGPLLTKFLNEYRAYEQQ